VTERRATDGCMGKDEQKQVSPYPLLSSHETGPSAFNSNGNNSERQTPMKSTYFSSSFVVVSRTYITDYDFHLLSIKSEINYLTTLL
jgi:hypothetical protein